MERVEVFGWWLFQFSYTNELYGFQNFGAAEISCPSSTKNMGSLEFCRRKRCHLIFDNRPDIHAQRDLSFSPIPTHPERVEVFGWWLFQFSYTNELYGFQNFGVAEISCPSSTKNMGSLEFCRRKRYIYTFILLVM